MKAVHDSNCTPEELAGKRQRQDPFLLLDVRTGDELDRVKLDPCMHIPLQALEARAGELDPWREQEIVCMCHHGVRSAMAAGYLRQLGFARVRNLTGGIDAYAAANDPGMPRY